LNISQQSCLYFAAYFGIAVSILKYVAMDITPRTRDQVVALESIANQPTERLENDWIWQNQQ